LISFALVEAIGRDASAASAIIKFKVQVRGLCLMLDDFEIISEMGRYYADKVRGCHPSGVFRKTG